ncbi:MAG: hypothetical protein OXI93_13900 [Bryobacterales bacterium]|nr:hypothetical protein [Bryobacterales bacterium]
MKLRYGRAFYHSRACADKLLADSRPTPVESGMAVVKSGIPSDYEWIETTRSIMLTVGQVEPLRHGLVGRCLS